MYFNQKKRYNKQKLYEQYEPWYADSNKSSYDLRFIILRHAERVDAILGDNWYKTVFGNGQIPSSNAYKNSILPTGLPKRLNPALYTFDPPITRNGQIASIYRGHELLRRGIHVDYCYASPASRCVITANSILQGMNKSHIPIALEPTLFEPLTWNLPFQYLDNLYPFLLRDEWKKSGYRIDKHYRPLYQSFNVYETEFDYLQRSQELFYRLEKRHGAKKVLGNSHKQGQTVLLVGHAATPAIFSDIVSKKHFSAEELGKNASNIPYLYGLILQRNPVTHQWNMKAI